MPLVCEFKQRYGREFCLTDYSASAPCGIFEYVRVLRHATESGVLSHLIGALSEFGKLGLTAIASNPAQVDELYAHTLEVLDRETTYGM